jgi:CRP-like cAMP-binding protein
MSPTRSAAPSLVVPSVSEASRSVMEYVTLTPFQILEARGEPPSHVYFPAGSVVALLLPMAGGRTGLAALVGREGMVGVEAFLGAGGRVTNAIAVVQSGGPAWRLTASQFQYEVTSNFALRERLTRYTLALVGQIARTASCAREHTAEQQIARWLLQSADRMPVQAGIPEPERVAGLLGMEREAAVSAFERLERKGAVSCRKAPIRLFDRSRLEASACSCYAAMRDNELRALLPHAARPAPPRQHDAAAVSFDS